MPSKQNRELKDARARVLDDLFGDATPQQLEEQEEKPEGHQDKAAEQIRKADTRTAAQETEPETMPRETTAEVRKAAPEGYQANPAYIAKYIEKRARRFQLVLTPSLYEAVKARAKAEGRSMNDFIHTTLEAAIKDTSKT